MLHNPTHHNPTHHNPRGKHGKYGFIKPAIDAHTLGINSVTELLRDCGYEVVIADEYVARAMNDYKYELKRKVVVDWIVANEISHLGISYRLDHDDAVNMIGYLVEELKKARLMQFQGGQIERVFFGGLPGACAAVEKAFKGLVRTFIGGESAGETLLKMGVPKDRIPIDISEGSKYEDLLLEFGKSIIDSQNYRGYRPTDRSRYPEYGTDKDTVVKRIDSNLNMRHNLGHNLKNSMGHNPRHSIGHNPGHNFEPAPMPLIRAHVGPYSSTLSRIESVNEFIHWIGLLARSNYLDILSIGSSQLTQSNFGEDWGDKTNGGGVPVNSPEEYRMIWEASRPLLVRTYAGTKNIPELAQMHEKTLNICWHALSLWWFNRLDARGPYDVYTNLKQHVETIKYIAKTNKSFEANVSHHFAFRGADDVTYIVSAYLAAKLAKKLGIKTFILQNMLNTPRSTWGIQDLAKSRALLKLINGLEDENFRVLFQPRAGLDYFKPDLYEARIQLAAVAALMDDIDPHNELSPPIIHVVSYSEASHLATPEIINESIQITQYSIMKYRELRRQGKIEDMIMSSMSSGNNNTDVNARMIELYVSAKEVISAIETCVEDPYSAEGFYRIFAAGFLPVPYLWGEVEEFKHAKAWKTKSIKGGVKVVDTVDINDNNYNSNNYNYNYNNSNYNHNYNNYYNTNDNYYNNNRCRVLSAGQIIEIAKNNLKDAEYNLKERMKMRSTT